MKVFSNTAVSLDGRINARGNGFPTLGTARDHARMSRLRAQADAVLVGGATFRNWPHPALPEGDDRALLGGRRPWTVVVSRTMQVPVTAEFLAEPGFRPLFLTRRASMPPDFPAEIDGYDGDDLPVPWILDRLRARGIERLLIEAGGDLLFQFLAADAIDEMHVTLCPLVIGGPTPSLADGIGFTWPEVRRLTLLSQEVEGDEIFLHYAVRRGAQNAPR